VIIVPTIRNTGTHFLLNLLGIKPKGMLWTEQEYGVTYGHIDPAYKDIYLPLIENNTTIIPLRHPLVVARSWQSRGGNILELVETWEHLVNDIDPMNPCYLPIDSEYRVGYLNALNISAGLYLKTDWEPVGSTGNHELRHQDIKGDKLIHDLVDRISGFLSRFYE